MMGFETDFEAVLALVAVLLEGIVDVEFDEVVVEMPALAVEASLVHSLPFSSTAMKSVSVVALLCHIVKLSGLTMTYAEVKNGWPRSVAAEESSPW